MADASGQPAADSAGCSPMVIDGATDGSHEGGGTAGLEQPVEDSMWVTHPFFGGFHKHPEPGTALEPSLGMWTSAGVFAIRGMRPTMEDHHVLEAFAETAMAATPPAPTTHSADPPRGGDERPSAPGVVAERQQYIADLSSGRAPALSFFGVFDGHGGHRASQFVSVNLRASICGTPAFAEGRMRDAILEGFAAVETTWMAKAYKDNMEDGTTAVVAFVVGSQLWIANVGDSEAILSRAGLPTVLSIPHNAKSNKLEERRVVHAGGKVKRARVVHPIWAVLNIGVTRSIGASAMKEGPNTDGRPSGLVAVPDIQVIDLTLEDEFLILACDGLWDVMSPLEAADFVRHALAQVGATPESVAGALVNRAFEKGSLDNITAVVIVFLAANSAGVLAGAAAARAAAVAAATAAASAAGAAAAAENAAAATAAAATAAAATAAETTAAESATAAAEHAAAAAAAPAAPAEAVAAAAEPMVLGEGAPAEGTA